MDQAINNLIVNACQAMPNGGVIKIGAENVTLDEPIPPVPLQTGSLPVRSGRYVKITISDSGVGIPKEYIQRVFEPYLMTRQKGSGLGLAIVHSVIKNHKRVCKGGIGARCGNDVYDLSPSVRE